MDDYLLHYGVKGMKWGVRKARPSSKGGKKQSSSTSKKPSLRMPKMKRAQRAKAVSKMSDDELSRRIKRIRLENEYLDLTSTRGERIKSIGRKVVSGVAETKLRNLIGNSVDDVFPMLASRKSGKKSEK